MMTVSELLELLSKAEDPDGQIYVGISDYGEVQLNEGILLDDGSIMFTVEGDEDLSWLEMDDDVDEEETGDDPLPAVVANSTPPVYCCGPSEDVVVDATGLFEEA